MTDLSWVGYMSPQSESHHSLYLDQAAIYHHSRKGKHIEMKRRVDSLLEVKRNSGLSWDDIIHVWKWPQGLHGHRIMAQKKWPHQSPKAQGNIVERSCHWTPDLQSDGDCRSMWSLSIRQTTSAPLSKREKCEQRPLECSSPQFLWTGINNNIHWKPILHHLRRQLLQAHLDLSPMG